uniref:C-type lectin domain-containing protein n=1 Tax=Daphnia galeata TaxID=27404 RepID=A0A8J2RU39_9CRUS|nr:unnamed protein product [Daphnia galeata]
MTSFSILGVFILAISSSISGNVLLPRDVEGCGGSLFVDDAVVIDVPLSANCKWQIQTEKDRVLVFTVVQGGNFKQVEEFLSIHDGMEVDSSVLLFENRMVHEVSNKELPEAVYTTGSVAEVRVKKTPTSVLKLKIQKAVSCPFNLGAESSCGRVVDEISCYCATFTKRNQASQTSYCNSHSMKLLAIESYAEEQAIQNAWTTANYFWTSGNDISIEGKWIWESTGVNLSPGYTNWADAEPNNSGKEGEDCLCTGWVTNGRPGWNDYACGNYNDAICEDHA